MEEEFHDQVAVVGQRPLCCINTFYPAGVGRVIDLALHFLCDDFLHPEVIEKDKLAGLGNLFHIPVQEGITQLFCRGLRHGLDNKEAGVNAADDTSDHASLSGGAPSLKNDHYRQLCFFDLRLIYGELFSGLLHFL